MQYKSFQKHGKSKLNIFIYSNSNIVNTHVYINNIFKNIRYILLFKIYRIIVILLS